MPIKKFFLTFTFLLFTTVVNAMEFTVMHAPGGVSDIVTRYIAKNLPDKNYVVVNRPGAAGKIAMTHLMSEKTFMLATNVQIFVTNPLNFTDLNYDAKKDLDILAVVGIMPSALVCNKKLKIDSYNQFLSHTKSLTFAVGGYGSSEHIATEVLLSKSNTKHIVIPYAQGGNKSVLDLIAGHVDCMFANYPTIKAYVDHENLHLLLTSHNVGLNILTWETVYKEVFPFQSYLSIVIPKSMNDANKSKLVKDFNIAFQTPNFSRGLSDLGLFPKSDISKSAVQEALNYNDSIRDFLVTNKIKTSGQ